VLEICIAIEDSRKVEIWIVENRFADFRALGGFCFAEQKAL